MTSIRKRTPAEIDHELADVEYELATLYLRLASQRKTVKSFEERAARQGEQTALLMYSGKDPRETLRQLTAETIEARKPLDVVRDAAAAEFKRRGGWSRYWLVCNTGGHVHKSRNCSSCYPTTEFAWLPGASGQDSAGLIELFGSTVCSVCFPEAPLDAIKAREKAAKREADKAAGYCEGQGRFVPGAKTTINSPVGNCPVCGYAVSVTRLGNARKHKARK